MLTLYSYFWEDWLLYHKAIFDGVNSLIYISPETTEIDIRTELYSDWKEWAMVRENLKFQAALRSVGGDPLPSGDQVGTTYFLINGWRIIVDHGVNFIGNIFAEEGDPAFITQGTTEVATSQVSTLPEKFNIPESAASPDSIATSVWEKLFTSVVSGSFGEALKETYLSNVSDIGTVSAGATTTSIPTTLLTSAGLYNNMFLQIIDGTNSVVRQISSTDASGGFVLSTALSFTPSAGASASVISRFAGTISGGGGGTTTVLLNTEIAVFNSSGVTLNREDIVHQTGIDTISKLPIVVLASANNTSASTVFGLVSETILNGATGAVLVSGQLTSVDTSSFSIDQPLYLSDTPGQYSITPGTITNRIGYAVDSSVNGILEVQ